MPRTITVSSRALGPRLDVRVVVYDTLEDMHRAAGVEPDCLGVTEALVRASDNKAHAVTIRLWRERLNTQIVSHEMHHATTALYGAHVGNRVSALAHLNHYNEPFAHLYSDMLARLVDRLYELGYYGEG